MSDLRLGDSTKYTKLAIEAATAFFERKTPLATKIASISQAHNLNNEEIRRVMEGANHLVHNTLRQKTATVEFEVATFDKIASALGRGRSSMTHFAKDASGKGQTSGGRTKIALEDGECGMDSPAGAARRKRIHERSETPAQERAEHRDNGSESEPVREDPDDAWRGRTMKRHADRKKKEKDAELQKEAEGADMVAHEKLAQAKGEFLMALQRFVMDENGDLVKAAEDFATYPQLAAAPDLLLDVLKIVKVAGQRMDCPVTFNEATMSALDEAGRKKTADQVDPSLYAAGLHIGGAPVEIIRGNHQVWKTLDTLVNQYHTMYPPLTRGPFGGEGRVNYDVVGVKTREVSDANHEAGRAI